jgi:hypothetical protein
MMNIGFASILSEGGEDDPDTDWMPRKWINEATAVILAYNDMQREGLLAAPLAVIVCYADKPRLLVDVFQGFSPFSLESYLSLLLHIPVCESSDVSCPWFLQPIVQLSYLNVL